MSAKGSLSFSNQLGYGLGDFAFNLSFNGVIFYLYAFYTDTLKVDPILAGTIFLVAGIWDGISDPIMGYFAERTQSRWGKYRPYLLWGGLPLGLSYLLMFYPLTLSGTGLIVFLILTQVLYRSFFTLVNIPYASLAASMTQRPEGRASLATYRMFLAYAGALLVSSTTPLLIAKFEESVSTGQAYFFAAALNAFLTVLLVWLCFAFTFEPPQVRAISPPPFLQGLGSLGKNTPFLRMIGFILVGMAGVTFFYQSLAYYFRYVLKQAAAQSTGMFWLFGALMLTLPLWNALARRTSKRTTLLMGCVHLSLGTLLFYFLLRPSPSLSLVYVMMAYMGIGIGCTAFSFWAMLPDTVEYGEWKSGVRSESLLFGIAMLALKISLGIGPQALGVWLSHIGYIANQSQTPDTLAGIHLGTSFALLLPGLGIALVMFAYPIDRDFHRKILQELAAKNPSDPLGKTNP